jgi:hypothetical protein
VLTVADVKRSAVLNGVVLLMLWEPRTVTLKEVVFERGVVVVKVGRVCESMCGIVVRIQIDKRTAAANKVLSKEKVNSFLCRNVTVSSHSRKEALSGTFCR